MHTRQNISFNSEGLTLRGWLYSPKNISTSMPGIIMTHGFSCLKEHGLDQFAAAFSDKGFIVLIYDNRNFGDSDGTPRLAVDPLAQVRDMKNAISFMQTLKNIDADKIGLWGASLSAGISMVTATQDSRVQCLCLQVPKVAGSKEKIDNFIDKLLQQHNSEDPNAIMIPVVAMNKSTFALTYGEQAYNFFTSVDTWQNQVTLSSLKDTAYFVPADVAKELKTPTLFIVVDNDVVTPTEFALKAFEHIDAPKKLVCMQGEHFSPCLENFEACCEIQIAWFEKYLCSTP